MPLYLADSSIWVGRRRPGAQYLEQLLTLRLGRGELATCVPVALEVLVGAHDGGAFARDWLNLWQHLVWLPLRERATGWALDVQSELARATSGGHHVAPASYLVAACAEHAGHEVVLWHWDDGIATICQHTGQPHEPEHVRARGNGFIG